jgi:hypothetical protein
LVFVLVLVTPVDGSVVLVVVLLVLLGMEALDDGSAGAADVESVGAVVVVCVVAEPLGVPVESVVGADVVVVCWVIPGGGAAAGAIWAKPAAGRSTAVAVAISRVRIASSPLYLWYR